MVTFPDPDLQVFENLPFKVVVIDRNYRIVYANQAADLLVGQPCHKALWAEKSVCKDCRVKALFDKGETFKKAGQGHFSGRQAFMTCEYRLLHNHAVCFLDDKTQMVAALKTAKEQSQKFLSEMQASEEKYKAQHRMLRHKLNTAERKLQNFPMIMDGVSAGVIMIDKNHKIQDRNARTDHLVDNFWNQDPETTPSTCYQLLFHRKKPCNDCPISDKGLLQNKLTQKIAGDKAAGYVMEEFSQVGDDFVLSLNNSSRMIELAMEIRSHLSELEEINRILNAIVRRGVNLQNSESVDLVFEQVLEELSHTLFPGERVPMALITKQTPSRNVEQAAFFNMPGEERKRFLRTFNNSPPGALEEQGWTVFALAGGVTSGTGFLVVRDVPDLEEKRMSILKIFLNMVGSRVDNLKLVANLERQAHIDGLTGTYNRAYFEKRMEEEKEKAEKVGLNFSIIVIDINGLKRINDKYGHQAGDALIVACGNLLKTTIRESDILSRFGGDEYVILMPSTASEGVTALEARINTVQEEAAYCFSDDNGDKISQPLHMSVGAASSEETGIDKVFNLADERMYEAKDRYYQTHDRYR
ncbi:sensor domain-containing diguanylate cyclase [Acanthopleuribacter pedis]|uniref:diguanylate cyclase n=1 Tax=Acanthopleuribacter pedis TaxID=442870 RepID=A0A8J7QD46_9BACT|nr:sensor domain-containing diguanylate cyclase [Acanthopleuribacter pedis]MBO1316868.1 diguanylate cyclase [Acanthopleuribacter pedis]